MRIINDFIWYSPEDGIPKISIAKYGITLSKNTYILMGKPDYIKLGYNSKDNIICLKICDKNDINSIKIKEKKKFIKE